MKKNNKSHIFKYLHSTTTSFSSYNSLCFKIIDKTSSKFDLKIKEALHINCRKPNLNAQKNLHPFKALKNLWPFHYSFCPPCSFLSLFVFLLFFAFLFHLLFSLSLTLIFGICYCLNYTLLLLCLITTHLVSHLFLSSIVFIISTLIIDIFYCLNYTLLFVHLFLTHLVIDFIITM